MKCQNCNHNEAEFTISVRHRDVIWETELCVGCAAVIQQHTAAALSGQRMQAAGENGQPAPLFPEGSAPQLAAGQGPPVGGAIQAVDTAATGEFRLRRRRNELNALLQEAVATEAYEEAAELRDALRKLEKEVCTHDG